MMMLNKSASNCLKSSSCKPVSLRLSLAHSRFASTTGLPQLGSSSKPSSVVAQATPTDNETQAARDPVLKYAQSIGLPTEEGVFGFRPFSEIWCGRLAMMGFIVSIMQEFITGRGTLAQIYLMEPGQPDYVVLGVLCAFFGGAMLVGSGQTLNGLKNGTLSIRDVVRYKNFLALGKPDDEAKATAADMKMKGDFTTPGVNGSQIAQSKAEGAPVDAFLSTNDLKEGESAAQEMKAGIQPGASVDLDGPLPTPAQTAQKKKDIMDTYLFSGNSEMRYAQNIELTNGRYAMTGFLAAVLVEAATGNGIIGQLFVYAKWSGLLGSDSGF